MSVQHDDDIINAEIIPTATKTVPYTITGYTQPPVASTVRYQRIPVYRSEPPTSVLAVISVILAGLAVLAPLFLIQAPLAVITGYLALGRSRRGLTGGARLARIGVIAGLIEIGIALLALLIIAIFSITAWQTSPDTTKLF